MRGMLINGESLQYIVAVEYILEESGQPHNGGLSDWTGSFVPAMAYNLTAPSYVLELEDGRRGRINIFQKFAIPDQPTVYRFQGHSGINQ